MMTGMLKAVFPLLERDFQVEQIETMHSLLKPVFPTMFISFLEQGAGTLVKGTKEMAEALRFVQDCKDEWEAFGIDMERMGDMSDDEVTEHGQRAIKFMGLIEATNRFMEMSDEPGQTPSH